MARKQVKPPTAKKTAAPAENVEHVVEPVEVPVKAEKPKAAKESAPAPEKKLNWYLLGAVVVLSAVVYSNAINLDFVFDDLAAVQRNLDVNPKYPIKYLFLDDFWGTNVSLPGSHKSYRPVTVLSFRLNRYLAEGPNGKYINPEGQKDVEKGMEDLGYYIKTPQSIAPSFHLHNVIYNVIVCALMYLFAFYMPGGDNAVAFISSAIFATHPVHVEAVAGIVGRADLLAAIFSICAFFSYRMGALLEKTRWPYIFLASGLIFLGNMSKEVGMLIVVPLFVYDFLLVPNKVNDNVFIALKDRLTNPKQCLPFVLRTVALVGTLIFLLWFRQWITVIFIVPDIRHVENPLVLETGLNLVLNVGMLHAKYAQMLLFPVTLSCDWSYRCIDMIESVGDVRNIWTIIVYAAVVGGCFYWAFHLNSCRYYLFPMSWLIATFFPSMNIFFFVGTFVAERLLYVPSIGFCLLLGLLLAPLLNKKKVGNFVRTVTIMFLFCYISYFATKTFNRNPDWKSDTSLYHTSVEACPNSAKAQMLVGQEYQGKHEWEKCIPYLKRALEIEPDFCETEYSLGVAIYRVGSTWEGLEHIEKGIECNFTVGFQLRSLLGMYSELIRYYPDKEIVLRSFGKLLFKMGGAQDAAKLWITLGYLHNEKGEYKEAAEWIQKAAFVEQTNCKYLLAAGHWSDLAKDYERAVMFFEGAAQPGTCSSEETAIAINELAKVYPKLVTVDTMYSQYMAYTQRRLEALNNYKPKPNWKRLEQETRLQLVKEPLPPNVDEEDGGLAKASIKDMVTRLAIQKTQINPYDFETIKAINEKMQTTAKESNVDVQEIERAVAKMPREELQAAIEMINAQNTAAETGDTAAAEAAQRAAMERFKKIQEQKMRAATEQPSRASMYDMDDDEEDAILTDEKPAEGADNDVIDQMKKMFDL